MKGKITKNVLKARTLLLLLTAVVFVTAVPKPVAAKSLYVIADKGFITDATQPIHVYDIGADGTLTFQAQHIIRHRGHGAVGMAMDSDKGFLFITYERSEEIQLLDAATMTNRGTTTVPDAEDLAGIVYDHEKKLVYCAARRENLLYAYEWDPATMVLTHVPDSPFMLWGASTYGIALDEIDDRLYVANGTDTVSVYSTSDWRRVDRIELARTAISIAVDVTRGFLYTGAGFVGNTYLTQYDLKAGTEEEIQVEPDAGVMGLGVDRSTGYVYLSTGADNAPGGDNLQVYDTELNLIDLIPDVGNPTGLVVPGKDISYNPLSLRKTVIRGASSSGASGTVPTVGPGDTLTYGIHFNNVTGTTVTGISITDTLPDEVIYLTADDDGISGSYDAKTHTYTWQYASLPPDIQMTLELTVRVRPDVQLGTTIMNTAAINSKEVPPTTTRLEVVTGHNPLNLTKTIVGSAEGQIIGVGADDPITYSIDFNNDNDFVVTDISIVDVLPDEVSFVSADEGAVPGEYDPATHTCIWSLPSLGRGKAVHLSLIVRVNKDVAKGTIFANSVTVESMETPPAVALAEAIVGETPSGFEDMKVLPEIIRRTGASYNIQVSIIFPQGIGKNDIADVLPILYPGEIKAKRLFVYGTKTRAKVVALFDKDELLDAIKGYGEVTLRMVGALTSGRSYDGEATVYITEYSGR